MITNIYACNNLDSIENIPSNVEATIRWTSKEEIQHLVKEGATLLDNYDDHYSHEYIRESLGIRASHKENLSDFSAKNAVLVIFFNGKKMQLITFNEKTNEQRLQDAINAYAHELYQGLCNEDSPDNEYVNMSVRKEFPEWKSSIEEVLQSY